MSDVLKLDNEARKQFAANTQGIIVKTDPNVQSCHAGRQRC